MPPPSYAAQQRTIPTKSPRHRRHLLSDPKWLAQGRARIWNGGVRIRRPNESSWTARIVTTTVMTYALQMMKPSVTAWGVKLSQPILRGEQLHRLISPALLHGSIFHLFTNMASLNNVGVRHEQLIGSGRHVANYVVAGALGNVMSAVQSPNPGLGASGAVFGVMASMLVFLNRHDWLLGNQGRAHATAVKQTLLVNLAMGALNPMVDNWAHVGGALGGATMAYYFGPRLYLADLPDGKQVVVDKPIWRLPRAIESLPERAAGGFGRVWDTLKGSMGSPTAMLAKANLMDTDRMSTPSSSVQPTNLG